MTMQLLILACSGAVGCAARVAARDWLLRRRVAPWWSILVVNLLGAAAMGAAAGAALRVTAAAAQDAAADPAFPRFLIQVAMGFLGGWTTYSAFAMDVLSLWLRGRRRGAVVLWAATIGGSPLLALAAMRLASAGIGGSP